MLKILSSCLIFIFLTACTSLDSQNIYNKQHKIENLLPKSFIEKKYHTDKFTLHGLLRPANSRNSSLHVYIEGDGLAWINRRTISENPTPTDYVTSNLARNDKSTAAVLYLSRPCQYVQGADRKMCEKKYWTSHRLAPEVISSLNQAISMAKEESNAEKISIVGYSGGGGAAVLVAAKRDDVEFLGTIAGLLDHKAWTDYHKISPLTGSLNAVDSVNLVQNIRQLHLSSRDDRIVPFASQENYCRKLRQSNACKELDDIEHNGEWWKFWEYEKM